MIELESHAMAELFSVKARIHELEELAHPIAPDNLPARLKRAEREVAAMDLAEEILKQLDRLVKQLAGTEKFARALEIAFAPCDFDGYKRVAEYYRRSNLIESMSV